MQIPIKSGVCATFEDGLLKEGIISNGATPWGHQALWLGDRETGGWERFLPIKMKPSGGDGIFKVAAGDKDGKPFIRPANNDDPLLVLVRTGSRRVKKTQVPHGIFTETGSPKKIEAGTIGKKPNISSHEELWALADGDSILVLSALGTMRRIENDAGTLAMSSASQEDIQDRVMERTLDDICESVAWAKKNGNDKVLAGALHRAFDEVSDRPDWFDSKNRRRFSRLVSENQLFGSLEKRLEGIKRRFPDGRFWSDESVIDLGTRRKGPSAKAKVKKSARSEKDRQRTMSTRGKSTPPPSTHQKPKKVSAG